MCGIVGYIGSDGPAEVVIEGLTRLEYRGYDSAGISVLESRGELQTFKKSGELAELKSVLPKSFSALAAAIGHTRWATHGEVNDENAHPHVSSQWSCVHNGIIENFSELKSELEKEGVKFFSQTDSEVFVRLLERESKSSSPNQAITKAFSKTLGNSAFVILHKESGSLYAIKRSAPLVLGKSMDLSHLMISSDPYALIGRADEMVFPEDDVLCVVQRGEDLKFFEMNGEPSERFSKKNKIALIR